MNTKEVLIAARKKIERPECWTKGGYAEDETGRVLFGCDPDAVRWCSVGAIDSVVARRSDGWGFAKLALERALPSRHRKWGVIAYNDIATHADVLALFDRAIEACAEGV